MSESGTSNHPLIPDLLVHRDSFLHYLAKIHFCVGEDPGLVPRIMRWISICKTDAYECRALGYQILMDQGEFLIGKSSATFASIDSLYEQRKLQISEAERLAISTQWPACRIIPGKTLAAHEVFLKNHTLAKHVGISEVELRDRLAQNIDHRHESAFFDRATAESAIAKILGLFSTYVSARLLAGDRKIELPKKGGIDVGFKLGPVVARDGTVIISTRIRIILKRDSADPLSFHITTSYPTI